MLATRILPPQFLLPAWTAQQLRTVMQREFQSGEGQRVRSTHDFARRASRGNARKGLSLFDELFPEQKQHSPEASADLDKLPPFKWIDAEGDASTPNTGGICKDASEAPRTVDTQRLATDKREQKREASVLVLNAVTKNLEESDFFRLSPKGEHIEGWTSGIIKVIPARNPKTLESLGHYFILFSNDGAARAYLDQTMKLHTLAKTNVRNQGVLGSTALPGILNAGEDLETILRGFSLVPAHNKLSLRFIKRPYQPAMVRLLSEGGYAAVTGRQKEAEEKVLFSVDGNLISRRDLWQAISDDGKRRNLHWRLAGGGAKTSTTGDAILSLGNSTTLTEELDRSIQDNGEEAAEESRQVPRRRVGSLSKYIISFEDGIEARRFVREWHRRRFPRQRGRSYEDELPMMNAEILW